MEDESCEIKKERRIDKVDIISSLPEPLLQHIMSFLPFKHVVQTSVLSKVWRQAWFSFPVLEFDEFNSWREKTASQLQPYWEQILQSRHRNMVGVGKMTLKTYSRTGDSELADRCVFYAIENNVKELVLQIEQSSSMWYNLPPVVLCSKSIEVLKLEGCKLELPRSDLKLSLRKLCLHNVHVDDDVINNLFLRCGFIEDMEVIKCQGFKSLKLHGLSKLSKITLYNNDDLRHLKIDSLNANSSLCICSNMPYELDICKRLTSLSLSGANWTDSISFTEEWLCTNIYRLPLLEKLSISHFYSIERMKISSCRLKSLEISVCIKLVEVRFETPNLSRFSYTGDVTISFSSSAALTLSETHLFFVCFNINPLFMSCDDFEPEWYVKYIEQLANFRQFSQVLTLESRYWEHSHFPGQLRQILTPPLSGVKHLKFTTRLLHSNYALAEVVDFLLWISPHAETICLEYLHHTKFHFLFSYKQPPVYEGKFASCCKSLPFLSCWEHCIEKVEITKFYLERAYSEVWKSSDVKGYVVEGENILEKINGLVISGV